MAWIPAALSDFKSIRKLTFEQAYLVTVTDRGALFLGPLRQLRRKHDFYVIWDQVKLWPLSPVSPCQIS